MAHSARARHAVARRAISSSFTRIFHSNWHLSRPHVQRRLESRRRRHRSGPSWQASSAKVTGPVAGKWKCRLRAKSRNRAKAKAARSKCEVLGGEKQNWRTWRNLAKLGDGRFYSNMLYSAHARIGGVRWRLLAEPGLQGPLLPVNAGDPPTWVLHRLPATPGLRF